MFIAAFLAHVTLKFGTMRRSLKTRAEVLESPPRPGRKLSVRAVALRADRRVPRSPRRCRAGRCSATVGAGSVLLLLQGAGQSLGGPFRSLAFLLPRGRVAARPARLPGQQDGGRRRNLGLRSRGRLAACSSSANARSPLSREQLLALPQHTYDLPIACVEGWSTTQRWSGVRLRDLASLCGVSGPATVTSQSLEHGTFGHATLGHEQVADDRSLLALRVNGLDLSLDHGYPARVISPAVPGVHCTKWVSTMTFEPVAR